MAAVARHSLPHGPLGKKDTERIASTDAYVLLSLPVSRNVLTPDIK